MSGLNQRDTIGRQISRFVLQTSGFAKATPDKTGDKLGKPMGQLTMPKQPENYGKPWTHEELVVAFDLYCRIPFQQTKAGNPQVRHTAKILRRSPAAIARKLGNFGAFDPALRKKNISGLTHVSRLDQQVWDQFHNDWNALVLVASELRGQLAQSVGEKDGLPNLLSPPRGPSERITSTKQRIHQGFFRSAVLSSYHFRCCITGIAIPEALVASHIVPWSASTPHRADPTNGLCLSATFDKLFDRGLLTIDEDYRIVFSPRIQDTPDPPTKKRVLSFARKKMALPERFIPSQERLKWHRQNVFVA